jgi:hypothetical protein
MNSKPIRIEKLSNGFLVEVQAGGQRLAYHGSEELINFILGHFDVDAIPRTPKVRSGGPSDPEIQGNEIFVGPELGK